MKRTFLLIALIFSFNTIIHAQDNGKKIQWNKKTMDSLKISVDVQDKINVVKKTNDAEIKKVKSDVTLTEEVQKQKLKELRKQRMNDIEVLITPEQKKEADAMRKSEKKDN